MSDVQWYYARNEQQFGPISASELKRLADTGRLAPEDLLWREGMESWAAASNLRGLFSADSTGSGVSASASNRPLLSPAQPPYATSSRQPQETTLYLVLRVTQLILWSTCVLVVLLGTMLFMVSLLGSKTVAEEATAAAVFATFFLSAYVLARSGEKLSRLLLRRNR